MDPTWNDIVVEALNRSIAVAKGPVPGARLRQTLMKVAAEHGLSYPPADFADKRFSQFLREFENLVIVLRRQGKDILVAPANNPQLLVESSDADRVAEFREDIFSAFTKILKPGDPAPWYSPQDDQIKWIVPDTAATPGLIQIPAATLESEVAIRREFAASVSNEHLRERLLEVLATQYCLRDFSAILRSEYKLRTWHHFRFDVLTKRIRQWCMENKISWSDAWLKTAREGNAERTGLESKGSTHVTDRDMFAQLISGLSRDDLRRIDIPLDLVLKMLENIR